MNASRATKASPNIMFSQGSLRRTRLLNTQTSAKKQGFAGALRSWVIAASVLLASMGQSALGQSSNYWNVTGGGSFTNAANWSAGTVPTTANATLFTNNSSISVSVDMSVTNSDSTINSSTGALDMNILAGATWLTTNNLWVGTTSGSSPTLSLTNGGTAWVGGTLTAGNVAGSTGTVKLANGQLVVSNNMALGLVGVGNMTLSGGTLTVVGNERIGGNSGGTGTLTINGGTNTIRSKATGDGMQIGYQGGGTGTVNMAGGALNLVGVSQEWMIIGNLGFGTLNTSGGSSAFDRVLVGNGSGSVGTWNISGGTTTVNRVDVEVGTGGAAGTVSLSGGRLVVTATHPIYVGVAGTNNNFNISGGELSADTFNVGWSAGAAGKLTITGGSNVFSGYLKVGSGAGGTGTVAMSGGYLSTPSVYLGTNATSLGAGRFVLSSGGILETTNLVSGLNGSGVFTNQNGGVLQFTTAAPTITTNAVNSIVVTNAVISYRGVAAADIANSQVANITFQGNNAFQLNAATNATGLASYTFDSVANTANPANYQELILTGVNPLWQSAALKIGSGGQLLVTNATGASMGAVVTNLGAISVVNNAITWKSNVVVSGGSYLSMGGTNTFSSGLLVTGGGVLGVDGFSQVLGTVTNNGATMALLNMTNVDVKGNWTGTLAPGLSNVTWIGNNTFRLDNSSTTNAGQSYTFNTGLGATNYVGLEMVNGTTLYQGGGITIGAGGSLLISNTTATLAGVLTNNGTTTVVQGTANYQGRVLVTSGGSYLSQGATNNFNGGATIAAGGTWVVTNGLSVVSGALTNQGTINVGQGTATYLSNVVVTGGGSYNTQNATNNFNGGITIGDVAGSTGTVNLASGQLVAANPVVGASGVGNLIMSGGRLDVSGTEYVGEFAGSRGTLTINGGTNAVVSTLNIGAFAATATGTVNMAGGVLTVVNGGGGANAGVGSMGVGTLNTSGGQSTFERILIGNVPGSQGTWNISGGTSTVTSVGLEVNSTGTVSMTGGRLVVNPGHLTVNGPLVNFTVSGGELSAGTLDLGLGKLTITGGSNVFSGSLKVGTYAGTTGTVAMSGGYLSAPSVYLGTNVTSLGAGRFVLSSGGIIETTNLVSGLNGSGVFTNQNGGVLQFTTAAPTITTNSANSIVVSNAVISYRGVAAADIANSQVAHITFQGNNTFRLNGSTNVSMASYTFDTNSGPYAQLELTGANSLWQSTNLTVGAGGAVIANASARISVLGTYQNQGSSIFSNLYTVASGSHYQSWGGSTNQFAGGLTIASGGGFDVTNGQAVLSGAITNQGLFSILNAGIWNPSSGSVTVGGGLLQVGTGGALNLSNGVFTLANVLTNSGTIDVFQSAATYASNVVLASGGSYNSRSSSNTFSGGLLVGSGALFKLDDLSRVLGTVTNNGIVRFINVGAITNSLSPVAGTGLLDLNQGTVYLTNGNSYSGGTLISGGGARAALGADDALGTGAITFTGNHSALSSIGSQTRTLGNSLVFSNNATLGNATDTGLLILNGGVNLGGAVRTLSISNAVTMNGVVANGGLTMDGGSILTLAGANTYSGDTTINGGTLKVTGTNTSSAITINSGGILKGNGVVGTVVVGSGGTISPGNSPGTLTVGDITFGGGGNYNWQVYDALGSAGVGYGTLSSTGTLTISATSIDKYNINLWSFSAINPDVNGAATNFNSSTSYSWNIGSFTSISGFSADKFNLVTNAVNGTGGFANTLNGSFSLAAAGGLLNLLYTPLGGTFIFSDGTGKWSTAGNWASNAAPPATGAAIEFSGAGGMSSNDVASSVKSITFNSGSFIVNGNALTLSSNAGVVNNAGSLQTVNNDLTLGTNAAFTAALGNLAFGGTINNGGYLLTLGGSNNTTVSGAISGAGGLDKIGIGTASLFSSNTYTGGTTIGNGTLALLGSASLASGVDVIQGGILQVSNAAASISGVVSNQGVINVVNSRVTYGAPVVISGGYISDPSTNTFTENVTVTASGYLIGGHVVSNADLFVFEKDLLMLSTNHLFDVSQAGFLFTNSATHLLSVSNSGALDLGAGQTNFAQVAANFAIGTLSIAPSNRVTLAGNQDTRTNALYVGWLDLQGALTNSFDAATNSIYLALNLPNINLYYNKYDPRNNWLNVNLIGSEAGGYNLWGGGLLLPIPEPSTAGLILGGALFSACLLRRKRE